MELSFSGVVWYWRGPAPFYFVSVPANVCDDIRLVAHEVTYGWCMIPCDITIGTTTWYTALWPKDGGYIVPLKKWVRDAEQVDLDDVVEVTLSVRST
ncbi:MAG TPA: DUF1905 domain-containing protein [Terrimesophilobacter sp.]|mgnify:CR=1 FL=1|nr:DUF1905 domain-containing protein [Terrimesophilobacter sp.]